MWIGSQDENPQGTLPLCFSVIQLGQWFVINRLIITRNSNIKAMKKNYCFLATSNSMHGRLDKVVVGIYFLMINCSHFSASILICSAWTELCTCTYLSFCLLWLEFLDHEIVLRGFVLIVLWGLEVLMCRFFQNRFLWKLSLIKSECFCYIVFS